MSVVNIDNIRNYKYKDLISKEKIPTIFLILVIIALFWYSSELQALFHLVVLYIETYTIEFPLLAYALFFGLAVVSTLVSPFSSVALVPFAIELWGTLTTLILLLMGWIVGGMIAYYLGKHVAYKILRIILPSSFEFYSRQVSKKTKFWMALLFRAATPSEIGYLFGIIKYDFSKYLLATIISEIPYAILAVYVSNALIAKNVLIFLSLGLLLLAIMITSLYFLHKKLKNDLSKR